MNGPMGKGRQGRRGQLTGEALRRLIEEGEAGGTSGSGREFGDVSRQPSDAALRDLAAALRIAATTATSEPEERAARETVAVAAFRAATTPPAAGPRTAAAGGEAPERWGARLHRARRAVLLSVAAAVLGGGVAVAGGGIPFVGASPERGTGHPAGPSPDVTPTPSATGTEQQAVPPLPATGAPDGRRTSPVPSSGEPSAKAAPPPGGPAANERALPAHCAARARNPQLTQRPLVEAAGGRNRVAAFCATLLSTTRATPDRRSDGHRSGDTSTTRTARPPLGQGKEERERKPRAGPRDQGRAGGQP